MLNKNKIGYIIAAITIIGLCCAFVALHDVHAAGANITIEQEDNVTINYKEMCENLTNENSKLLKENSDLYGRLLAIYHHDADFFPNIKVPRELANNTVVQELVCRIVELSKVNDNLSSANDNLSNRNDNYFKELRELYDEHNLLSEKYNKLVAKKVELDDNYTELEIEHDELRSNYTALKDYVLNDKNVSSLDEIPGLTIIEDYDEDCYCCDDDVTDNATAASENNATIAV